MHLALNTLINQTKKADKIILCLNQDEFTMAQVEIPQEIEELVTKELVTILWAENLKSHKKLVPALMQYPNAIIVTCDDDVLYPSNWLELLHDSYLKYPKAIHCHRAFQFIFNKTFSFPPGRIKCVEEDTLCTFNTYLTGCGGVLYPPNSLHRDVTKHGIFMKIASENDDYWFWAMALLNRTRIVLVKNAISEVVEIDGTDEGSLYTTVNSKGHNNVQLQQIMERYPRLKRIIYWDVRWFKYLKKAKTIFRLN